MTAHLFSPAFLFAPTFSEAVPVGEAVAGFAAVALTRGSLPLVAAAVLLWALRNRSPALRHAAGVAAIVALPLTVAARHALPAWRAAPAWSAAEEPRTAPAPPATVTKGAPRPRPATARVVPPRPRAEPIPRSEPAPRPEPASVTAATPEWSWSAIAGWAVVGGAGLFVLRLLVSAMLLRRAAGRGEVWNAGEELANWKRELGVRRPVAVRIARGERMPLAFGVRRPTVLLPASFPAWSAGRRRAVGLHELAHVARRDPLRQGLTETVRAACWFHPLLWIVAAQTARAREEACDDLVLGRSVSPAEYARTLVALAAASRRRRPALGTPLTASGRVERRVRRLFDADRRSAPLSRFRLTGVTLATALLALGTATLGAAVPDPPLAPASSISDDSAVPAEAKPPVPEPPDADGVLWDDARHGWRVGAKLIMAGERLEPGDPLAIQFYLKNVAEQSRTRVIEQFDGLFPTLSAGNELTLNLSAHTDQRWRHTVEPGGVLRKRQYRVSLDTTGLPPGEYRVNVGAVFWSPHPERENTHTSLSFRRPLSVTIGDPAETAWAKPPATPGVTWGEPVAGVAVGLKQPNRFAVVPTGELTADLWVVNLTDDPIAFTWDVPGPTYWMQNMQTLDGAIVGFAQFFLSGIRVPVEQTVTLKPGEPQALTGTVSVTKRGTVREATVVDGPRVRIVAEEPEPSRTDGRPSLVTAGGDYRWFVSIEATRPEIPDLSLILTTGGTPVTVGGPAKEEAPPADAAPAAGEAPDEPPGAMPAAESDGVVWDESRDGWQVGAELVAPHGRVEPGDSVTVQLLLRNVTDKPQKRLIEQFSDVSITLSSDNDLRVRIGVDHDNIQRHVIGPGEVLRESQHRATFETAGLPPGQYHVGPRQGFDTHDLTGRRGNPARLYFLRSIPVTIGDPSAAPTTQEPPGAADGASIFWGEPVAGMAIGLELPVAQRTAAVGDTVEGTAHAINLSDRPIEFTYNIPDIQGELVPTPQGEVTVVNSFWYWIGQANAVRTVQLKPGEAQPLTGLTAKVLDGVKQVTRRIDGPRLELRSEPSERRFGNGPRLVTEGGEYRWQVGWYVIRPDLAGATVQFTTGRAPLTVTDESPDE